MNTVVWIHRLAVLVCFVWIAWACGQALPEPESEDAQLYVTYCSGAGCHDPIPPQGSPPRYWDLQYARMIQLMQQTGRPLPSAVESEKIQAYLQRHALR